MANASFASTSSSGIFVSTVIVPLPSICALLTLPSSSPLPSDFELIKFSPAFPTPEPDSSEVRTRATGLPSLNSSFMPPVTLTPGVTPTFKGPSFTAPSACAPPLTLTSTEDKRFCTNSASSAVMPEPFASTLHCIALP